MKAWPHTTITFVSSGEAPGHTTRSVFVNGTPVTVALGGVEVSQPSPDEAQTVTLTLLPDAIHFVGPDEDGLASTGTDRNGDLSDDGADQAPTDPPTRERPPEGDPDEALARVICKASGDSWIVNGTDYLPAARAAREHIAEEGPLAGELDAAVWHRQFEKEKARGEKAEADLSRRGELLTWAQTDRDAAERRAVKAEAERDGWRARHAALRAAVQVTLAHAEPDSWADLRLRRILDRDDARDPQAD